MGDNLDPLKLADELYHREEGRKVLTVYDTFYTSVVPQVCIIMVIILRDDFRLQKEWLVSVPCCFVELESIFTYVLVVDFPIRCCFRDLSLSADWYGCCQSPVLLASHDFCVFHVENVSFMLSQHLIRILKGALPSLLNCLRVMLYTLH